MNCPNHPDALADARCASCGKVRCRDCVVELNGETLCAECKEERVRALRSGESGAAGVGTLASPWRRLIAVWIDSFIFMGALVVAIVAVTIATGGGQRPALIFGAEGLCFFAWFIYEWKMIEASGQTLGKKVMSLKVVTVDGGPLAGASWKRAACRIGLGILPLIGLIDTVMIFGRDHQTLHDRVADSLVVDWKR